MVEYYQEFLKSVYDFAKSHHCICRVYRQNKGRDIYFLVADFENEKLDCFVYSDLKTFQLLDCRTKEPSFFPLIRKKTVNTFSGDVDLLVSFLREDFHLRQLLKLSSSDLVFDGISDFYLKFIDQLGGVDFIVAENSPYKSLLSVLDKSYIKLRLFPMNLKVKVAFDVQVLCDVYGTLKSSSIGIVAFDKNDKIHWHFLNHCRDLTFFSKYLTQNYKESCVILSKIKRITPYLILMTGAAYFVSKTATPQSRLMSFVQDFARVQSLEDLDKSLSYEETLAHEVMRGHYRFLCGLMLLEDHKMKRIDLEDSLLKFIKKETYEKGSFEVFGSKASEGLLKKLPRYGQMSS